MGQGQQSVRQKARRAALDAQAARARARAEAEGRLGVLAVEVAVAVAERDAAVAACELRAGRALRAMVDGEGVPVREALHWCGSVVTLTEATRLRRLAADALAGNGTTSPPPDPDPPVNPQQETAAAALSSDGPGPIRLHDPAGHVDLMSPA